MELEFHQRVVDMEGYISVDTNRYSVPGDLMGRHVEVRQTKDQIEIYRTRSSPRKKNFSWNVSPRSASTSKRSSNGIRDATDTPALWRLLRLVNDYPSSDALRVSALSSPDPPLAAPV